MDQFGRRSGYAYEYQKKIAAYTGWQFEYVDASWPELMEMLKNGEIDLMSDVSYTDERAEEMRFSSLPMGAECYCLFVSAQHPEYQSGDASLLWSRRRVWALSSPSPSPSTTATTKAIPTPLTPTPCGCWWWMMIPWRQSMPSWF